MRSCTLLLLAALPLAAEMPPAIPSGPVSYDAMSYEPAATYETGGYTPDAAYSAPAPAYDASYNAPVTPSSERRGYINLNAYSSNYQVRGMGLTDSYTHYGYSSLSGSYTLPNRNLFGRGLQQRLGGELGSIWGADDLMGDTPLVRFDYAVGKEIFPNLTAEVGYSLHHGGMEGYFAHAADDCPHRLAQDINVSLTFDDRQRGFFGHVLCGLGFQGLTGTFCDAEVGYRFTSVLNGANLGADVELSAGVAPSFSYWAAGADGVDAYRVKVALPLFTHNGTLGHDAHPYLRPWVSAAWSGNNSGKISRRFSSAVDHFQLTMGLDLGWNF